MKYIAEIGHVREVALRTTAEPTEWETELAPAGLSPHCRGGRAEVIISATAASWKGKRFRELTVAVAACRHPGGAQLDGYYLACAFHSSRVFGWIERAMFKTPHRPATIAVHDELPVSIEASRGGVTLVKASMGDRRGPVREVDDDWDFPVFLPERRTRTARTRRQFHARIRGRTQIYAFVPSCDQAAVPSLCRVASLSAPGGPDLVFHEWCIRQDASHARSRTYVEAFGG